MVLSDILLGSQRWDVLTAACGSGESDLSLSAVVAKVVPPVFFPLLFLLLDHGGQRGIVRISIQTYAWINRTRYSPPEHLRRENFPVVEMERKFGDLGRGRGSGGGIFTSEWRSHPASP